jgi:hypothetical protein
MVMAGVQTAKQGLPACKAIETKSWDFASFDSATQIDVKKTNLMGLGVELENHRIEIMKLVIEVMKAYDAGDWLKAGELWTQIMKLIKEDIGPKDSKSELMVTPENDQKENMGLLAQGFLEGTKVGEFELVNLLLCIGDVDQAAQIVLQIVKELEDAYKTKNLQEVVQAILGVVSFVAALKLAPATCGNVFEGANWSTYNNIVDVLSDPKMHMIAIGKNIVMNN